MNPTPKTPEHLLDALVGIFPAFLAEWEDGDRPETLHGVVLRFTPLFGARARTSPPDALRQLGDLIDRCVAEGGPLENAISTCLLEHLHQVGAWVAPRPYLSDLSRRSSRA